MNPVTRSTLRILVILVWLFCLPASASCSRIRSVPEEQWDKWRATGISNYRFRLTRDCNPLSCTALLIDVRSGKPVRVRDAFTGKEIDPAVNREELLTIDALFRYLIAHPPTDDQRVLVDYDPIRGFPTTVNIPPPFPCYDCGGDVRISEFEAEQ